MLGPIAVFTLTLQTLYGGGAFHDYLSSAAIDARHALLHIERDAARDRTPCSALLLRTCTWSPPPSPSPPSPPPSPPLLLHRSLPSPPPPSRRPPAPTSRPAHTQLRGNATLPEPAVCSLHENALGQCALADERDFSWEQTWREM